MKSVFFIMLAGVVIFIGCKTFEPEPDLSLPLSSSYQFDTHKLHTDTGKNDSTNARLDAPAGKWWEFLGSDELNGLIDDALDNNFDLKTLKARLDQAQANIAKAEATFFPDLNFSIGGQKRATQVKTSRSSSSKYDGSHSWDGSLSGSYSPDVWGEAGSDKMVKVLSRDAADKQLESATLEMTAKIAQTWVDIIAVRNKKEILDDQIKTNNTLLELLILRFVNGRASALEVSQQQEALAESRSQKPLLEKQEYILLNSLALLSGRSSARGIEVKATLLPGADPIPEIGIPSDLLENRPDIQAARMRLSSARWEIKAAKADLLPSFNLSAQALFSSGQLDLLFHNWVASLVGSIAGPLFDGGFRRAEVDRARAFAQEQVNIYASTVAKAVLEVEDSLISIEKQDEYVRLLEQELAISRIALKDARVQYQNGQSTYLNYLIAWSGIQRLERQLAGEKANTVKERIGLYQALGWQSAL